jgi:predicted CXXCH cytochrome family protein
VQVTATKSTSILMILAMSVAASWAAVHPVPLDPKADTATCVQCHEDKTKGKAVHTAISMGCSACHEIRISKTATRVKLKTATTYSLCLTCHADKAAAKVKGKVHPPAVRDCTKCHDPHTSDNQFQLVKAMSGDSKDTNLCLTCHKIGVDVPKDGSRHAALDIGCNNCHTTHKTGQRGVREFDFHLTKDAPSLCLDCHDTKDPGLLKAHRGQPYSTADCLNCHDPHQSEAKHLMAKYTHMPFAGGQCETCHQPAKDGKVVLTAASAKEICVTCHSDKGEQIEKAKVQHPGAAGDCTDCHNPHGGSSPYFPKPNPVAVCTGCHDTIADQGKKAHPHQPVFEQGCGICHDPHGNNNTHLLRAASPNQLCLECHGPDAKPAELKESHQVAIFDGKVKLPENYFKATVKLPVAAGTGHPIANHPISDVRDLKDPAKTKSLNCLVCHQPHASSARALLVKDQAPGLEFCRTCHTTMVGEQ